MKAHHPRPDLEALAEDFWGRTGLPAACPRALEEAIALALPLNVVRLHWLSVRRIEEWLSRRRIPYAFPCRDRALHGCLVAYRGMGFIFADESDPDAERLFTLAHETAHFLLDYHQPRESARARFGAPFLEALDGLRPPTLEEQVAAWSCSLSVVPYAHLLDQEGEGRIGRSEVWRAENRADDLALELLAPSEEVRSNLRREGKHPFALRLSAEAFRLLTETYGLPAEVARRYGKRIAASIEGEPSLVTALGLEEFL